MASFRSIFGGLAAMAVSVYAALDTGGADEMGPAAFMWPADRVWSASMDNTAPCGSVASPGNRSEFPLQNGKVALVGQDESYDIELSISYKQDPKSNSDFSTIIDADEFKSIDPGHTCVSVPDADDSVKANTNATLQIKYIASFDKPENETFYACADITFVELVDFDESMACFNATKPADELDDDDDDDFHHNDDDDDDDDGDDDDRNSSAGSESGSSNKKDGGSGLSGGAIAGIVVGSVAGVAIIGAAAFLLYRRKSRHQAALRQQQTARGVSWENQPPKNSQSTGDVRMNDLS
ncbi:GPI anchored [Fusarium albosuccineum]|uniref:GPI anchored n=1 Tax=Fusarium albosuccineum TaxID=1237068 RepID=A0A8H4L4A4_9HYPO|nr:GPI anchored [Fusarium albosuccineum]